MAFPQQRPVLSHDLVRQLCGDLLDWKINAILETGADPEELEEAVAWASGEDDVMGEERKKLSGHVADIYDILTADEEPDERP